MGDRGPVPNRSDDLARPRSRKGGDQGPEVKAGTMKPVSIYEMDEDWHPIAKMIWESLIDSGQSDFYQQSDWAYAYSLCDDISMFKKPWKTEVNEETGEVREWHKRSPEMLKAIQSAMSSLMMTEADRRRVRVELAAPAEQESSASVVAIADYQAQLGIAPEPAVGSED